MVKNAVVQPRKGRARRSGVNSMEIFEKRGRWCFRDEAGKLHKFGTEEEAKLALGWIPPVEEILDGGEEEESSEEEASTDE